MQIITRPAFWIKRIKEKKERPVMKRKTKATEDQIQITFCIDAKEKQLIFKQKFREIKGIRDNFTKKKMCGENNK